MVSDGGGGDGGERVMVRCSALSNFELGYLYNFGTI